MTPHALRSEAPSILLVGPYDPSCGEYTFLAPPLGVWRLAGVLSRLGYRTEVFDPNCTDAPPRRVLEQVVRGGQFDVIGFSTTGMTLVWDLELAHLARSVRPRAILVAGGMEATFDPDRMFELGPFDLAVLGEGERPLASLLGRLRAGAPIETIPGTAWRNADGSLGRIPQPALDREELRDAIFATPYDQMPYAKYWERLEEAYRIGSLPFKAQREARLAEIRSVRLITLNYCPMRCTFCSSTNFLNAAQDGTARLARLEAAECIEMIARIVSAHPDVRTIIFQDDIFVFPNDHRIEPLTRALVDAKRTGRIPAELQFISTNRIDAMTPERLRWMREAGFRVLGFGIENFSPAVLAEFNKSRIVPRIVPALEAALELGITPFLDVILTSPRCTIADLSETIRQASYWIGRGCEVGMYPWVIPFSGAAMSADPALTPHTTFLRQRVAGTSVEWDQPVRILPIDPEVREAILAINRRFTHRLEPLESEVAHLPSRVRSLLWIASAIPELTLRGQIMPKAAAAEELLRLNLPPTAAEAGARARA